MIVDLMRNDLGRVCTAVTVPELCRTESHPGVWHLVSDVTGTLREGVTNADLLRATFPPGSVTGAPKVAAMGLIAELEAVGRGVYTGCIGIASPVSGLELSVAIRTFEVSGTVAWLGVGGGVVADSEPLAELSECITKAAPLVAALGGRLEMTSFEVRSARTAEAGAAGEALRRGPAGALDGAGVAHRRGLTEALDGAGVAHRRGLTEAHPGRHHPSSSSEACWWCRDGGRVPATRLGDPRGGRRGFPHVVGSRGAARGQAGAGGRVRAGRQVGSIRVASSRTSNLRPREPAMETLADRTWRDEVIIDVFITPSSPVEQTC